MTKNEFLEKLGAALGNDLSGAVIQDNVKYYKNYIEEEVDQGRSEEEVLDELGDPWVLAQTVIDSVTTQNHAGDRQPGGYAYEPDKSFYRGQDEDEVHPSRSGDWWRRLALILAIIGIVMILFVALGGFMFFAGRFLLPLLIVLIVVRTFSNKRQ